MKDWKDLTKSQIKAKIKGRAGRIAELQMEIEELKQLYRQKITAEQLKESAGVKENPKPSEKVEEVQRIHRKAGQEPSKGNDDMQEIPTALKKE